MSADTIPAILYDSALRQDGITYTIDQTEVDGRELPAAYDWRDWSFYQASGAWTTVVAVLTIPDAFDVDAFAAYVGGLADGESSTLTVEVETGVGAYTTVGAKTFTYGGPAVAMVVSETAYALAAGKKIRLTLTKPTGAVVYLREIAVGTVLLPPSGQHDGVKPPQLAGGATLSNPMSVSNSFLGRDVQRREKDGSINLTQLDPEWVREEWELFARHAERFPFFYAWDYLSHPGEVAFSYASEVRDPTNGTGQGLMSVEMPIRSLTV